eukprot:gene9644-10660_t
MSASSSTSPSPPPKPLRRSPPPPVEKKDPIALAIQRNQQQYGQLGSHHQGMLLKKVDEKGSLPTAPPPPPPPPPSAPALPAKPPVRDLTPSSPSPPPLPLPKPNKPLSSSSTSFSSGPSPLPSSSPPPPPPPPPTVGGSLTKSLQRPQSAVSSSDNSQRDRDSEGSLVKSRGSFLSLLRRSEVLRGSDSDYLMDGLLAKRNREGVFEKCHFYLTATHLNYHKVSLTGASPSSSSVAGGGGGGGEGGNNANLRSIALEVILVQSCQVEDHHDASKRDRCFRLMSKTKSFLLKAVTSQACNEWMTAIRSVSLEEEVSPVWTPKELDHCQLCQKKFGLLHKKHHCRNCGKCVCERCSLERVRLLRLDPRYLFKVCNPCAEEVKAQRQYGLPADLP